MWSKKWEQGRHQVVEHLKLHPVMCDYSCAIAVFLCFQRGPPGYSNSKCDSFEIKHIQRSEQNMKSSCAFSASLGELERWIIPMTALELGTRFPWFALQRRHPNSLHLSVGLQHALTRFSRSPAKPPLQGLPRRETAQRGKRDARKAFTGLLWILKPKRFM